jgi:amidase
MSGDRGLVDRSALSLRDLIASKAVSPVEVLEAHLAEIARLNPTLNAIVTLAGEQARAAAVAAEAAVMRGDQLGPLHGLPLVIKDITETAGITTTYASPLYRDHVPDADAEVVARLKRAGAIILGKTNTPEFAAGANTVNAVFGATRNPWNTGLSPAGSSGGSAVAVATGMAPLAQGTDFGCSVRIPAAFCGIVGLRTTPGLIPNDPMPMPWDPGQVHGPLARSAEDAALMLDAMTGLDPLWPISLAPTWDSALAEVQAADGVRGLKIAYVPDIAGIGVDPEVDRVCRAALAGLEADGARVAEVDFDASAGNAAYLTLRAEWMVGQQYKRLARLDEFDSNLAGNVRDGLALTVTDTAAAQDTREAVWRRFRDLSGRAELPHADRRAPAGQLCRLDRPRLPDHTGQPGRRLGVGGPEPQRPAGRPANRRPAAIGTACPGTGQARSSGQPHRPAADRRDRLRSARDDRVFLPHRSAA